MNWGTWKPAGESKAIWRAALYARLSRDDGTEARSESISEQLNFMREWCDASGNVHVVSEYYDDGDTGASFDRPGFNQMIEDARAGSFDTIVVRDLSRFGRSYLDCGSWIERELPKLGVRLYSIGDDFDSMRAWDYNMAILVPFKNIVNEMQVITTSQKVRTSLMAKRARGECVSNFAPYGYAKDPRDKHRLVVDEGAARTVECIFREFATGKSASAIARELNDSGTPSPAAYKKASGSSYFSGFETGKQPSWHAETVLRILRNETYSGTLVQGRTMRPNWRFAKTVSVPESDWVRHPDAHEAIVERDLFDRVQVLLGREIR